MQAIPASDIHHQFLRRTLMAIMVIGAASAALFGILYLMGLNNIGAVHAGVDFGYSAVSLLLLELKRRGRIGLIPTLQLFLLVSFLTFVSALVNVPADQFRGIWLFLLVFVAFLLGGRTTGIAYTLLSILVLVFSAAMLDLQLNPETLVSMTLGLLIFSVLSFVYARQSFSYADLIETKNQQLEYLASRDPLTGIFNSRSYQSQGTALLALARRSNSPLSLMYLDIDHFKHINDQYGHHVGDQVLTSLVALVAGLVRDSDVFARIGGEEFCVLLPDTDLPGALTLADKLRQTVGHEAIRFDGQELRLTVSIGVTALQDSDVALRDMEKRADEALYQAKLAGRDRVSRA